MVHARNYLVACYTLVLASVILQHSSYAVSQQDQDRLSAVEILDEDIVPIRNTEEEEEQVVVVSGRTLKERKKLSSNELDQAAAEVDPDIFIVGTVDGSIHGVNPKTGERLWSTDEVGGPTVKSFQKDLNGGAIIPGDDGLLYLFSEEETKLASHHLSIPDIVNTCPFTDSYGGEMNNPNSRKKIRVVGEKRTSYYELDPNTGQLLRVFSSEGGSMLFGKWETKAEGEKRRPPPKEPVFEEDSPPVVVGRVDYRVRAFDDISGEEVWNFTYGKFVAREKNVPELQMEGGDGFPSRATWNGIPVTNVFGLAKQKYGSSWSYVSQLSGPNNRDEILQNRNANRLHMDDSSKSVYLQQIIFKGGDVQVYATKEKPGKDLRCSPKVFPVLDPDAAGPLIRADAAEVCAAIESDFPFEGPYMVSTPKQKFNLGLPEPLPNSEYGIVQVSSQLDNSKNEALVPKGGGVGPTTSGDQFGTTTPDVSQQLRALQLIIVALVGLLLMFVIYIFRRQRRRGDSTVHECIYDEKTNSEIVGKLTVELDSVLGRGCHGTTVLRGSLRGRPVAVKKVLATQFQLANKEIDLLIRSDGHPNVVRYFTQEATRDFIYLALELCDTTLEHAVRQVREVNRERFDRASKSARKNKRIPDGSISFLYSLADATNHLHNLKIVHCDIKPQNILVIRKERDVALEDEVFSIADGFDGAYQLGIGDYFTAKLSDMGLGKKFSDTTSSIYGGSSMHGSGTIGWRAPELLLGLQNRQNDEVERDVAVRCGRKVDIFSMGCVFFYVITGGHHPFGDALEREKNVLQNNPVNLPRLECFPEAHDLIGRMINPDPEKRPTMNECLQHPFLWNPARKLDFLKHLSDRLEAERDTNGPIPGGLMKKKPKPLSVPESFLQEHFEKRAEDVFGKQGWLHRLHPILRQDVVNSTRRYYSSYSLRDLLRYMRNKYSHVRELEPEMRDILTPVPEGFLDQFIGSNRFPKLLMVCYELVLQTCAHEPEFEDAVGSTIAALHRDASLQWVKENSDEDDVSGNTGSGDDDHIYKTRSLPTSLESYRPKTPPGPRPTITVRPPTPPPGSPPNENGVVKPPPGFESSPVQPLQREESPPMKKATYSPPRSMNGGHSPQNPMMNGGGYTPQMPPLSLNGNSVKVANWRDKSSAPPVTSNSTSPVMNGDHNQNNNRFRANSNGRYQPPPPNEKYKTSLCKNWEDSNGTFCRMGDRCHFAHGVEELRSRFQPSYVASPGMQ